MQTENVLHPALTNFTAMGQYRAGAFQLLPEWARKRGLYVWIQNSDGNFLPRRVGIACGSGGFGARYASYNRWLAGKFKPNDAREQEVRRLMLEGLGNRTEVWGYIIDDKKAALRIESYLRVKWRDSLNLDPMVKTSWIGQRLSDWRESRRAMQKGSAKFARALVADKGAKMQAEIKGGKYGRDIEAVARSFLNVVRNKAGNGDWVAGIDAFNAAIDQNCDLQWVRYIREKPKARSAITTTIRRLMREEFPDVQLEKRGARAFYRVRSTPDCHT